MSSANTPDIFISYAHVDNSSQDKAIDHFVKELEAQVNQQVGRSAPQRIWKDNRLDGNQPPLVIPVSRRILPPKIGLFSPSSPCG